jgi:DNA-binding protein HU-beta
LHIAQKALFYGLFKAWMRHFFSRRRKAGPPSILLHRHVTRRNFMAKSLTKSATITKVAELAGKSLGSDVSKKEATAVIDALVSLAYKEAKNKFTVPGLGKIVLRNTKARMGRNPKTGEPIQIKAKRVVKFRVAKAAKDAILGG